MTSPFLSNERVIRAGYVAIGGVPFGCRERPPHFPVWSFFVCVPDILQASSAYRNRRRAHPKRRSVRPVRRAVGAVSFSGAHRAGGKSMPLPKDQGFAELNGHTRGLACSSRSRDACCVRPLDALLRGSGSPGPGAAAHSFRSEKKWPSRQTVSTYPKRTEWPLDKVRHQKSGAPRTCPEAY